MKRFLLWTLLTAAFGFLFAACSAAPAATSAPTVAPTLVPPTYPGAAANANMCATDNHAPSGAFRSDRAGKLTASAKPKFIEFYAEW